jgi:kynurenine 3-monooxygenase
MDRDGTLTIVGSGLAGALLACYLGRAGRRVAMYEKRPDPRLGEAERGRSINLALSTRGLHALGEVGLADEVLRQAVVMRGRMIHHLDGSLTFQPYGKDDSEVLHSVSRGGLNRLLVEAAAKYPGVEMQFDHRCVAVDLDRGELEFQSGRRVNAEVIVGADGAYSAVRQAMQRRERFDYSQEYLGHGYKELEIAPGPAGGFRLEKHALHIWPRGGFMLIALPNGDGSFTCTLFAAYEGPNSFASLAEERDVLTFFERQFPDAVPLLPDLAAQFRHNPVGTLVTIRCSPWHVGGRAVLIGDAAHAVVPFLGQGMNAAFEDCSVLMACLKESRGAAEAAFAKYDSARKPALDTLARLCVDNYLEMRDRVGSRWFVVKKKLAIILHRLFPRWYIPLYSMVEFTTLPYDYAEWRARWQRRQVYGALGICAFLLALFFLWLLV